MSEEPDTATPQGQPSDDDNAPASPVSIAPGRRFYLPRIQQSSASPETGVPADLKNRYSKINVIVEKTKLDHSALKDVVQRSFASQEIKVAEQLKSQICEPFTPFQPIETYKMASRCTAKCTEAEGKQQVSFCEQCHLFTYDFSKMEQAEADELIFKQENKRNPILYKRQDGRFLTSDCPIGAKKKRNARIAIIGSTLAVISSFALLIMFVKPEPGPRQTQGPPNVSDVPFKIASFVKKSGKRRPPIAGYQATPTLLIQQPLQRPGESDAAKASWGSSVSIYHPIAEPPSVQFDSIAPPEPAVMQEFPQQPQQTDPPTTLPGRQQDTPPAQTSPPSVDSQDATND